MQHIHKAGAKNLLVLAAVLHILQVMINSSEIREKGNVQSQKNNSDPPKKHTNNKLCVIPQRAVFIFLGQPARKHLTMPCTSCLGGALILLAEHSQACVIFAAAAAAGTGIMLKTYHFTFKSWSRDRLLSAAHLHFCTSHPVSVGVQSGTMR